MKSSLHGILVVNKPAGPSSFGVVKTARRLLQINKIGYLGTLDPFATGVLPLCLQEATKLAPYLLDQPKTYRATVVLGVETDTQDSTGTVISRSTHLPPPEAGAPALATFLGPQWQTPPLFSALHFQGRRLYHYARQGISVDVAPRQITIMELVLESLAPPEFSFLVTCSRGTYIRTLAVDLGRLLGCGAHLLALQRLQVGPFFLDQAVSLTPDADADATAQKVIPLADYLPHLPTLDADLAGAAALRQGRSLDLNNGGALGTEISPDEHLKIICRQKLVAVAVPDSLGKKVRPVRVFNT